MTLKIKGFKLSKRDTCQSKIDSKKKNRIRFSYNNYKTSLFLHSKKVREKHSRFNKKLSRLDKKIGCFISSRCKITRDK